MSNTENKKNAPARGEVHSTSSEGTAASHGPRPPQPLIVAPTPADDLNVVSLDLVPVACLSLHDVLFEYGSSFPLPATGKLLSQLPKLRDKHKNAKGDFPPLSIFGHADPVGNDAFNKALSGRRARAIYGLITHDAVLWDQLYKEEWKSKRALEIMAKATGKPAHTARNDLMQSYMSLQFPKKLEKKDFLARGSDPHGRADLQGCSDFNPLILLSTKENSTLPKDERNLKNQGNRRVLIYVFRPGSKVNPALWPCPAADDPSVAACKTRFFGPPKTGEKRRQPGPERREFTKSGDTFACRFYSRIGGSSPCEQFADLITIKIRLFNVYHEPMKGLPYELLIGSASFSGKTDADGVLVQRVPAGSEKGKLKLEMWRADLVISEIGAPDSHEGIMTRLENLGYHSADESDSGGGVSSESMSLMRFQSAYNEKTRDGKMNDDCKKEFVDKYGF